MATPVLWKDVVGFEGLYIVNCHGEIRSTGQTQNIAIGELSDDRKIMSSLEFNMTGVNPL